jgi:hypothetical protein
MCLLAPWPSAEAIFLRPGQGVNMNLLRGGEASKGTIINKIVRVLAALRLDLIYALVAFAIPTFLVTMSL